MHKTIRKAIIIVKDEEQEEEEIKDGGGKLIRAEVLVDLLDGSKVLDGGSGRFNERCAGLSWLARNLRVSRHDLFC